MPFKQLSTGDVEHFLEFGWIKIPGCFSREQAAAVTASVWTRLRMDPDDKATWTRERINLPADTLFSGREFAPKAWDAICDLLGGEHNIAEENSWWGDDLIANLGRPEGEGKDVPGRQLSGWHVDGDFFVHYLDSPEQALLVTPLFTDIPPGGGGTFICPNSIRIVAKHLYNHPEGVSMWMTPRAENPTFEPEPSLKWHTNVAASQPEDAFVEATGSIGDVYLMHPFMVHSASNNKLRHVRLITNPHISIKTPFVYDRQDGNYTVIEQKTLRDLEVPRLSGWSITAPREMCIPDRLRSNAGMKERELEKLISTKLADRSNTGRTTLVA